MFESNLHNQNTEPIDSSENFQPEKVERKKSVVPGSPYSSMINGNITKWHRGLRRLIKGKGLEDDFYQTIWEFMAGFESEFTNKFNHPFDKSSATKEEELFFYHQLNKKINQFKKKYDLGDYALDNSTSFEQSNETSLDGSENNSGNIKFSNEAPVNSDEYWLSEHLNLVRDVIFSEENIEQDKDLQWKLFMAFIKFGSERFASNASSEIMREISSMPEFSSIDINTIEETINRTLDLIKRVSGKDGEISFSRRGIRIHDQREKNRVEFELPSNLSSKEKVELIRSKVGITSEEEFKKKKGWVYNLIKRAESNNGKVVYFPDYHKKSTD